MKFIVHPDQIPRVIHGNLIVYRNTTSIIVEFDNHNIKTGVYLTHWVVFVQSSVIGEYSPLTRTCCIVSMKGENLWRRGENLWRVPTCCGDCTWKAKTFGDEAKTFGEYQYVVIVHERRKTFGDEAKTFGEYQYLLSNTKPVISMRTELLWWSEKGWDTLYCIRLLQQLWWVVHHHQWNGYDQNDGNNDVWKTHVEALPSENGEIMIWETRLGWWYVGSTHGNTFKENDFKHIKPSLNWKDVSTNHGMTIRGIGTCGRTMLKRMILESQSNHWIV